MTRLLVRFRARLAALTTRQRVIGGGLVAVVVIAAAVTAVAASDHPTNVRTAQVGGERHAASSSTTRHTTHTPPRHARKPRRDIAPLTGLVVAHPNKLLRPALAVKIDNLDTPGESALPQTGLNQADIVFEEVVEADITRLVAVFHSVGTDPVGPVRSARTTDVHLLPQLHRPLIAWSGGNGNVIGAIRRADMIDVGAMSVSRAYFRKTSRRAPHNLYVHPYILWGLKLAGERPPTPLFAYRYRPGAPAPAHSVRVHGLSITWGHGGASAPVSYRWDPRAHGWARTQRGRPDVDSAGVRIRPRNVVVLVTAYRSSPADARSPEAITVGSGEAFVFTNGRVVHGRWTRRSEGSAPKLVDDSGRKITLMPGRTWIELAPTGMTTTIH